MNCRLDQIESEINDWDRVLSVERLVFYLEEDHFGRILNLGRYFIIIHLKLIDKTIRAIVNGLLIALSDCYQGVLDVREKILLTPWGR